MRALEDAGLDPGVARELAPRHAFSRACKRLSDQRIIRPVSEDAATVKFQFTQESREGDRYEYRPRNDADPRQADRGGHRANCPASPPWRRRNWTAASPPAPGRHHEVVQRLFERQADLFPIRPQGGCYFTPACHVAFIDQIQDLLNRVGGRLLRFPVPAGTEEGDRSVTQAVADGLAAVVAEHRAAVAQFGTDTRDDTLTRAAEKIRTTKFKLAAYSEYLAGEKDRLDSAVADAERNSARRSSGSPHARRTRDGLNLTFRHIGPVPRGSARFVFLHPHLGDRDGDLCPRAYERTVLYLSTPALWAHWPFLPVVRRTGGVEELGVVFDARAAGLTRSVRRCSPATSSCYRTRSSSSLALPHETFDSSGRVGLGRLVGRTDITLPTRRRNPQ